MRVGTDPPLEALISRTLSTRRRTPTPDARRASQAPVLQPCLELLISQRIHSPTEAARAVLRSGRVEWSPVLSADEGEPQLAREILSYFLQNPHAADTLEGIARWRLLEEQIRRTVDETERSLRWLVSQGYLEQISISDEDTVFRLNQKRIEEGRRLLDEGHERQD